ncbi:hypothetical protein FACS1894172_11610 [Spirochaetia bacterium]|nr:hypothetical protein FACS1894164_02960 [Spirochaetia bacterium]GHU33321.1 hypothetical protein FACS1894172_11610 [Spirochaetia bacterium]
MRKYVFFILCVLLTGCASTGKVPEDIHYTLHNDIAYGPHERNKIDISIPDNAAGNLNVILFIHGGIWMYGDKNDYPLFLDNFRDRFIVASMNHRYIDEDIHMAEVIDDVSSAVSFIKEFSSQYGSVNKVVIMGHSSGAHLSLLYAYKNYKNSPIPIAFCVSLAAPTDLSDVAFLYNFKKSRMLPLFYKVGENATGYRLSDNEIGDNGYNESIKEALMSISPLYFVNAGIPPVIIVHDVGDPLVPYSNSAALNSTLHILNVDHDFIASYTGLGHTLKAKRAKNKALIYDSQLESKLLSKFNEYVEKYCN